MSTSTGSTGSNPGAGAGAGAGGNIGATGTNQSTVKKTTEATATLSPIMMAYGTLMVIFSILFAIFFSLGAALLSYRKFQSFGWAFLDFWFPYFYYPYYAFFINEAPTSTGILGMTGGGIKKIMKLFTMKRR
jgi:hypothetical protein